MESCDFGSKSCDHVNWKCEESGSSQAVGFEGVGSSVCDGDGKETKLRTLVLSYGVVVHVDEVLQLPSPSNAALTHVQLLYISDLHEYGNSSSSDLRQDQVKSSSESS